MAKCSQTARHSIFVTGVESPRHTYDCIRRVRCDRCQERHQGSEHEKEAHGCSVGLCCWYGFDFVTSLEEQKAIKDGSRGVKSRSIGKPNNILGSEKLKF